MKLCLSCQRFYFKRDFIHTPGNRDNLSLNCKYCISKNKYKEEEKEVKIKIKEDRTKPKEIKVSKTWSIPIELDVQFPKSIKLARLYKKPYDSISRRRERLKRKYNLSLEEYEQIKSGQDNCCSICKCKLDKPVIDYNYKTNKVISLICKSCNLGLRCFKKNSEYLKSAADYINLI